MFLSFEKALQIFSRSAEVVVQTISLSPVSRGILGGLIFSPLIVVASICSLR